MLGGRMAERTKATVLKTVRPRKGSRGFESRPLRSVLLGVLLLLAFQRRFEVDDRVVQFEDLLGG